MIDAHRKHWIRAHHEGLPAMKADSLFRIALHCVAHDRLVDKEYCAILKRPRPVAICKGI
jgi:hypothetical protein